MVRSREEVDEAVTGGARAIYIVGNQCDWQVRDGNPNDHADAAHDRSCIGRLEELAAATAPVVTAMATTVPRLQRYNERLATAVDCVARGEVNRFTGVMCESFHDIWMELHEDLIVLQRIDRVAEGSF